jgi:hypothetical protein
MAASGHTAWDAAGDYAITRRKGETMTIPIPHDDRQLLDAPNYVYRSNKPFPGPQTGPRVLRDRG